MDGVNNDASPALVLVPWDKRRTGATNVLFCSDRRVIGTLEISGQVCVSRQWCALHPTQNEAIPLKYGFLTKMATKDAFPVTCGSFPQPVSLLYSVWFLGRAVPSKSIVSSSCCCPHFGHRHRTPPPRKIWFVARLQILLSLWRRHLISALVKTNPRCMRCTKSVPAPMFVCDVAHVDQSRGF